MKIGNSTYNLAIKFENEGFFKVAFPLFLECFKDEKIDRGDLLFHCGWCAEQSSEIEKHKAIEYYLRAGEMCDNIITKMNSYFRAGWIFLHDQKYKDAITAFKYAIETGHQEAEFAR
ncbi:hypothetical protein BMS3Abin03_02403 [bacterium BMS3Abin03]|nr:hypothetical protein BMS3Abin03_02403 [bacterium BMS3Abin03]